MPSLGGSGGSGGYGGDDPTGGYSGGLSGGTGRDDRLTPPPKQGIFKDITYDDLVAQATAPAMNAWTTTVPGMNMTRAISELEDVMKGSVYAGAKQGAAAGTVLAPGAGTALGGLLGGAYGAKNLIGTYTRAKEYTTPGGTAADGSGSNTFLNPDLGTNNDKAIPALIAGGLVAGAPGDALGASVTSDSMGDSPMGSPTQNYLDWWSKGYLWDDEQRAAQGNYIQGLYSNAMTAAQQRAGESVAGRGTGGGGYGRNVESLRREGLETAAKALGSTYGPPGAAPNAMAFMPEYSSFTSPEQQQQWKIDLAKLGGSQAMEQIGAQQPTTADTLSNLATIYMMSQWMA